MKNPQSKLGKLWQKFCLSGFDDNPIITTPELRSLRNQLNELADYMNDRNDTTMRNSLTNDSDKVDRMIRARKFK